MRHYFLAASIFLLFTSVSHAATQTDVMRVTNELRSSGCGTRGAARHLALRVQLSLTAQYLRRGDNLRTATRRADYRADRSAVIHVGGKINARNLREMLQRNYCSMLADADYSEMGIALDSQADTHDVWIVLAAPFSPPAARDANRVATRVLTLVNAARARPRRCGNERFVAAPALRLDDVLTHSAEVHARDMAAHGEVEHEGSDGSSPADRDTRAGYRWKSVGENIAGGQTTAEEVVEGWLNSPGHCSNIMDKNFTDMGLAFVVNVDRSPRIYWAQEFGQPR